MAFVLLGTVAVPVDLVHAEGLGVKRVESYVLPVGTHKPDLAQLRSSKTVSALRELSERNASSPRLPREAVGPLTARLPRAEEESGRPAGPVESVRTANAAPTAVSYPEPSHTMTAAECQSGLGASNRFFIKSRFAMCAGASFLQTWVQNNRPVGESAFNVLAVGTIPKDSRQVTITYYFTGMETTGTTGAAAMKIQTAGTIPLSVPATVRYTEGGVAMPLTRTWAQLQAASSFVHTLTAAAGQGNNGSTDFIDAAYVPKIKITPPAGWTLTGATSGDLIVLGPRWNKASYLNAATTGAANFAVKATLQYSSAAGAPERAVALHIKKAFTSPGSTKPLNALKDVPGQDYEHPLTRLYTDATRRKTNRARAVSACVKGFGADYATGGKQCDEYPFATTYEGCAWSEYDPTAEPDNFSVMPVPGPENGAAGTLLSQFYAKNRVVDGPDDGFIVQINP